MAKFSFSEIENAFMYVGSAMYGMNSAVVCKDTGKILYRSDMAGIDEIEDDYERVRKMFRRSGAYSRYKDLLERRGLLKEWYDIENRREERALRNWCKENEIELDG